MTNGAARVLEVEEVVEGEEGLGGLVRMEASFWRMHFQRLIVFERKGLLGKVEALIIAICFGSRSLWYKKQMFRRVASFLREMFWIFRPRRKEGTNSHDPPAASMT